MNTKKCPVCNAKGTVILGFYGKNSLPSKDETNAKSFTETCRSCNGLGKIKGKSGGVGLTHWS